MMEHHVQISDGRFGVRRRKILGLKWNGNGKGQMSKIGDNEPNSQPWRAMSAE